MFCRRCGRDVNPVPHPGASTCPACGARLPERGASLLPAIGIGLVLVLVIVLIALVVMLTRWP